MRKSLCILLSFLMILSAVSITAVAEDTVCPETASLTIKDENSNNVIEADDFAKSSAEFVNQYGNNGKYEILLTFYDANSKLIDCKRFADATTTLFDVVNGIGGFSNVEVPETTSEIKAFMWHDSQMVVSSSDNQKKDSDDQTFGNSSKKVTVAFMGDSLTHGAQYLKVIEHYYQTRYPGRDIVFVNKGISGNSFSGVLKRFDWDITEHELTGDIDEATICLGFNDLRPQLYVEGVDYDKLPKSEKADVEERISTYANSCIELIAKCKEKGISLTLLTPVVFDHAMVDARIALGTPSSFDFPESVNDYGLRRMTEEIKAIAKKYKLPVIDVFTSTSSITDSVRQEYNLQDYYPVVTGIDGVHPEEQGGFYISYEFIKQQDKNCATVAKVEIDAKTGVNSTERADIILTDCSANKIEYEYLAHAIPLAYTSYYQKWEKWGIPVTENINNEIIKITNLAEGTYSVTIGGNVLTKNYTAEELEKGINVAVDANNPAQKQSIKAHKIAVSKVSHESTYRTIATTEQGIRNHPEVDISKFGPNSTSEELKVLGSYSGTYKNYFSDSTTHFGAKKYETQNWNKIRAEEQQARELSKPVQRTVVIQKVQ